MTNVDKICGIKHKISTQLFPRVFSKSPPKHTCNKKKCVQFMFLPSLKQQVSQVKSYFQSRTVYLFTVF